MTDTHVGRRFGREIDPHLRVVTGQHQRSDAVERTRFLDLDARRMPQQQRRQRCRSRQSEHIARRPGDALRALQRRSQRRPHLCGWRVRTQWATQRQLIERQGKDLDGLALPGGNAGGKRQSRQRIQAERAQRARVVVGNLSGVGQCSARSRVVIGRKQRSATGVEPSGCRRTRIAQFMPSRVAVGIGEARTPGLPAHFFIDRRTQRDTAAIDAQVGEAGNHGVLGVAHAGGADLPIERAQQPRAVADRIGPLQVIGGWRRRKRITRHAGAPGQRRRQADQGEPSEPHQLPPPRGASAAGLRSARRSISATIASNCSRNA